MKSNVLDVRYWQKVHIQLNAIESSLKRNRDGLQLKFNLFLTLRVFHAAGSCCVGDHHNTAPRFVYPCKCKRFAFFLFWVQALKKERKRQLKFSQVYYQKKEKIFLKMIVQCKSEVLVHILSIHLVHTISVVHLSI